MTAEFLHDLPLAAECEGKLKDFDVVEGLAQNHEAVACSQGCDNLLPRVVGIGRAKDNLERGLNLPEMLDGFYAIPAWVHAHVHEGDAVGPALSEGFLGEDESVLALHRGVDLEGDVLQAGRGVMLA